MMCREEYTVARPPRQSQTAPSISRHVYDCRLHSLPSAKYQAMLSVNQSADAHVAAPRNVDVEAMQSVNQWTDDHVAAPRIVDAEVMLPVNPSTDAHVAATEVERPTKLALAPLPPELFGPSPAALLRSFAR